MPRTASDSSLQQRLAGHLLAPLEAGAALFGRVRSSEDFQRYLSERMPLAGPYLILLLVTALACALAPILGLLGTQALAAIGGLLLAPVVLAGAAFVLAYVFFGWLEERALARSLGHRTAPAPGGLHRWIRKKLGADLGRRPPVPWLLAVLFVALPLAALARQAPGITAALVLLHLAAPILYARYDR